MRGLVDWKQSSLEIVDLSFTRRTPLYFDCTPFGWLFWFKRLRMVHDLWNRIIISPKCGQQKKKTSAFDVLKRMRDCLCTMGKFNDWAKMPNRRMLDERTQKNRAPSIVRLLNFAIKSKSEHISVLSALPASGFCASHAQFLCVAFKSTSRSIPCCNKANHVFIPR